MLCDEMSNRQEGKGKEWHSAGECLRSVVWKRVSGDQKNEQE